MTSNQPDLDAIQTRLDAASKGPWTLSYEYCDCSEDCGHGLYVSRINTGAGPATELCDLPRGEWELMVHAREDVDQLVAEVRRLRAELAGERERALDALNRSIENGSEVCADCGKPVPDGPCGVHSPDAVFQRACHEAARLRAERDKARAALEQIRHLHKDSPMGPCPVCIDADAIAEGRDGLMPYPCPTGRLAGAQDCEPTAPAARSAAV